MHNLWGIFVDFRPIEAGEEREAAALAFELKHGRSPSDEELSSFLDAAHEVGTNLGLQVVAVENGSVLGCAIHFPMPDGASTAAFPFCRAGYDRKDVHVGLLRALRERAAGDGVHTLQAFCDVDDTAKAEVFTAAGYDELATMTFLERIVPQEDGNIPLDEEIEWLSYSEEVHDNFVATVAGSYKGTLDCVKLGEERDVEATLESYKERAKFDPSLWWLAKVKGEVVGCLLLVYYSEEQSYEVTYIAVVPEHRGKSFGRKMMERGLKEIALRSPGGRIALAVDDQNSPALAMYSDLDFTVEDRRKVFFSLRATA